MNILVVDDEKEIADLVEIYLVSDGYKVFKADNAKLGLDILGREEIHLVLLDIMMPGMDGLEMCKRIRETNNIPIIMLSARSTDLDKILGLGTGADDYVVKPFELEILHSRILALLRRTGNVAEQYLSCDGILIDQNRHAVFCHSEEILLSTAEYQLLLYLMKNKGKTVAREKILEQIWDVNGSYVNNNTLTVTMKRLRDKLYQPKCLKTVRSVGYRMEDTI